MTDCRRTSALRDRAVTGTGTQDDRDHAATCATCAPVLARAARFDDDLRRAARGLVMEQLPRGILDPHLGPANEAAWQPRRTAPGLATGVAAVMVLLLATFVSLAPGGRLPPADPSPTVAPSPTKSPGAAAFHPTGKIRANLGKLDYTCNDGFVPESIGPGPDAVAREAAVCTAPEDIGPLIAAVIVGEARRGAVVELVVKADIIGDDTQANREQVAAAVGGAVSLVTIDMLDGGALGSWVVSHLPEVQPGEGAEVVLRGYTLELDRGLNAGYLLVIRQALGG